MTIPEILSLVWIVFVVALVIGVGFFLAWLNERALRRKIALRDVKDNSP